jgi:hypothetical protein
MTHLGANSERFEGKIWFISVYNKIKKWKMFHFSRSATDCKISLKFLIQGSDEGGKSPLRWMGTERVPAECNFDIGVESREGYADKLGFF